MSDVFLSYAREDRAIAEKIARTLAANGATVFWDRNIGSGEVWDEVLDRELKAARCVIVLWSQHSVASRWVRAEASEAAECGILLPALIEQVPIPFQFKPIQTVDLTAWNGTDEDHGMLSLLAGVNRHKAKIEQTPTVPRNSKPIRPHPKWRKVATYSTIAFLVLALPAFLLQRMAKSKRWFVRSVPFHTFLQSAEGLALNDDVLLNGKAAGKITEIVNMPPFDPAGNMFVAFDVQEPDFGYVWTDSRAKVQWHPSKQRRQIHVLPGGTSLATNATNLVYQVYKIKDGKLVVRNERTGEYVPLGSTNAPRRGHWLLAEEADP